MHARPHPLAGRVVRLPADMGSGADGLGGQEFRIEDWWDHMTGASWREATDIPAVLQYEVRALTKGLPGNDDVIYGKVGALGYLLHVSEVEG